MYLRDNLYSTLFPYMPRQTADAAMPVAADTGNGDGQPVAPAPTPAWNSPEEQEQQLTSMQQVGQSNSQPDLTGFDPSAMGPSVWMGVQPVQPTTPGNAQPDQDAQQNAENADRSNQELAKYNKKHPQMPDFSELPAAQRAYEEAVWDSQHAENQNHGFKGHLGQILSNFAYAMGQAYQQNPLISPGALLAVGGIGAGAGEIRPAWDERRMAAAKIPVLRQAATDEQTAMMRQGQMRNYQSMDESRKANAQNRADANQIKLQDVLNRHDDHMHRDLIAIAKQYPYLDSSDPEQQAIFDAFEKAGMPLADRNSKVIVSLAHDEKTGRWTKTVTDPYRGGQSTSDFVMGPDGKPVVTESAAQLGAASREKVADINAASRKYSADTSAASSRYSTDARTQLGMISDVNKLNQTRATILAMTPNKGENADAFKARQQAALAAVDARIGELQPK